MEYSKSIPMNTVWRGSYLLGKGCVETDSAYPKRAIKTGKRSFNCCCSSFLPLARWLFTV